MGSTKRWRTGPSRGRWNRMRLGERQRPSLMALLVLLAFLSGIGVDRAVFDGPSVATASTILTDLPEFAVLEQTYDVIRENYVLSDEVTDEELIYGASQGMVEAVGDEGHSVFLEPEEAKVVESALQGQLIGIGIHVDVTGAMPVVIAPIDNSPAFKAGIKSGDVIIAIDGVLTAELDPEEWAPRIRGEAGTDVTLRLLRGDDEPFEVTITRAEIRIDPVSWRMLPGGIAWVKLSEFSLGATGEMIQALHTAKEQGAKGVILDLRNNPGGYVFEAEGVGAQFLPDGSILYQERDKEGKITKVTTGGDIGEWLEGPLVVLINEGSASAAEIVSSSLQANDRATLIGQTTFGTGTVVQPFELSDGSVVQVGTFLWLTADGDQIWKRGVAPDEEVLLQEGAFPALPIDFPEQPLSSTQLDSIDDEQLQAGYDEVEALIAAST